MALSNWDCYAINECNVHNVSAQLKSPMGVCVEVYKNWLYVNDKAGWTPGAFSMPVVMQVDDGEVKYKDVKIRAVRGPQNGVYAILETGYKSDNNYRMVACCGVYGYIEDEWVGVTDEARAFLEALIERETA